MSSEPIARAVRAEYIGPRVPESLTVSAATTKNERPKKAHILPARTGRSLLNKKFVTGLTMFTKNPSMTDLKHGKEERKILNNPTWFLTGIYM